MLPWEFFRNLDKRVTSGSFHQGTWAPTDFSSQAPWVACSFGGAVKGVDLRGPMVFK